MKRRGSCTRSARVFLSVPRPFFFFFFLVLLFPARITVGVSLVSQATLVTLLTRRCNVFWWEGSSVALSCDVTKLPRVIVPTPNTRAASPDGRDVRRKPGRRLFRRGGQRRERVRGDGTALPFCRKRGKRRRCDVRGWGGDAGDHRLVRAGR